jgi:predicted glycogen debranching enzyme
LVNPSAEWLEADGLGGYASGTVGQIRTRRYHALLLAAPEASDGRGGENRVVYVNGVEVWMEDESGQHALSSQRYAPDVVHPDCRNRITAFSDEPWPKWTFTLARGIQVEHEVVVRRDAPLVALSWSFSAGVKGRLIVRPLLSARDYHSLHHENPAFNFRATKSPDLVSWRPYDAHPAILALSNGTYEQEPRWYRDFLYTAERERGLDHVEDLASPGRFVFDAEAGDAILILGVDGADVRRVASTASPAVCLDQIRDSERRRRAALPTRLHRSATDFVVRRGARSTIIAGYPWFTDWGRDTFISIRGLCIASGRLDIAERVLLSWSDHVSEGMLPNYFPDGSRAPAYNSVDASLWFVVAVYEYWQAATAAGDLHPETNDRLTAAVSAIVNGYSRGTRYGIRATADGLLAAGEPGVQLTWMDAMTEGHVVTPRIGKPVEVQALWINALRIAGLLSADDLHAAAAERATKRFMERFWNAERGCLYDVVDVDHREGAVDALIRPNQIFAVGGLPWTIVPRDRGRAIVKLVEEKLWTPMGLRTLAPGEPGYTAGYEGDVAKRDAGYHQGTAWPWLAGAFIESYLRVHSVGQAAQSRARQKFLEPLLANIGNPGLGHLTEIADAEPPHAPRGAPFQAWSLGELLRVTKLLGEK